MKYTRTGKEEVEVTHLAANMGVRYWEDATVNGEDEDSDSPKIPFATKDGWKISIELETGKVVDWPDGVTACTHYKVCDEGIYTLMRGDEVVTQKDGYVPSMLAPFGDGYGDYVILEIGPTGLIAGWKANLDYFVERT